VQTSLAKSVRFEGVGLHSGAPVRMVVHPASANRGIWFRRLDETARDNLVPAAWDAVQPARLCTLLRNGAGVEVSTVEHVMAALAGCGIHNATIELDGPEVPILDGSAAPFVAAFLRAGLLRQAAPLRAIEVLRPVEVRRGEATARLAPAPNLVIDFEIDFAENAIGHQALRLVMANGTFVRELSKARTFCRKADVDAMQASGLALGGTLDNAVVVDGDRVLSPGGLRLADEPVRHKMLDALGDLALAGAPLLAQYTGHRAGHAMTNAVLRALFATPGAWRYRLCDPALAARLPGMGLREADLSAVA